MAYNILFPCVLLPAPPVFPSPLKSPPNKIMMIGYMEEPYNYGLQYPLSCVLSLLPPFFPSPLKSPQNKVMMMGEEGSMTKPENDSIIPSVTSLHLLPSLPPLSSPSSLITCGRWESNFFPVNPPRASPLPFPFTPYHEANSLMLLLYSFTQ